MAASAETRLVVFDGLCNVCSGGARFLQRHEIKPPFRPLPMQSAAGRALLAEHGYDPDDPHGACENPQAGEGSQRERARGPPGGDRP
jgi:predicted DCC family thiol-disulfide oxidoreductase YuxK